MVARMLSESGLAGKVALVSGGSGGIGRSIVELLAAEGADAEQTDGQIADAVITQLEANKGAPFFIACGFFRPHTPYVSPKHFFDLYPTSKITLPPLSDDDRARPIAPAWASASPGAAAGWLIGTGAADCGPVGVAGEDAGGVAVAVWEGAGRSRNSPGLPIRYPATPEPSMRATTRAATVDRFMGILPP